MTELIKDGETWKTPDGRIVRRRTKKLRLIIARQRYIYKGKAGYARIWQLRKMINGVSVVFPLGADVTEAAKLADEIGAFLTVPTNTMEEAQRRYNPRSLNRPARFPTIGELFAVHKRGWKTLGISDASALGYQTALIYMIRRVEAYRANKQIESQSGKALDWTPWLGRPTTMLTARFVLDFKAAMTGDDEDMDEEEILTAKISCDSYLRRSRAVFSGEALKYFKHHGLIMPEIEGFFEPSFFGAKKYFELLPLAIVEGIFGALPALAETDRNAWRAFMLCCHLGMRKGEAGAAHWDWVEEVDGSLRMNIRTKGDFNPKHGHGRRTEFERWVWEVLSDSREDLQYILTGDATERTESVFNRLNLWLRGLGAAVGKPTHELRKLWFSYTVKTKSLAIASRQGGHRDPKITASYYADNMMPASLLRHWQKPA